MGQDQAIHFSEVFTSYAEQLIAKAPPPPHSMRPPSMRRKTGDATIENITFDPEARQDYLTGFHKRKLQRAKHAKDVAEKKVRAERIEERRKACLLQHTIWCNSDSMPSSCAKRGN
jgi:Nucleolar protein 12 (25kDa)